MSSPAPGTSPAVPNSPPVVSASPPATNSTSSPPPPSQTNSTASPPPPETNSNSSTTSFQPPPSSDSTNGSTPSGSLPPKPKGLPPGALAGLIVGIALGAIIVLIGLGIFFICYRRKNRKEALSSKGDHNTGPLQHWQQNYTPPTDNNAPPSTSSSLGSEKPFASPSPSPGILGFPLCTFSYEELAVATNGFSNTNLVGQGGFGYVHKGVLHDGKVVAIKRLKPGSGQGEREFQAEIEIISRVHHRHLVSLIGYCITGTQRILVYEFVPNNTLEFHLHGKERPTMHWSTRMKIAVGSAKGLAYLHEDCQPKIIHRDIKAANILLDDSFEAKVADFGLAKYSLDTDTHVSTRVMGTFGYMAPEYASSGKLTEKSDVFSFGVVLLELITGRRPVDKTQSFLGDSIVDWARPLLKQALEEGVYDALADPKLQGDYDSNEMTRMISFAAACIRHSARLRPRMSQIVRALEGNVSLDDLSDGITTGHSMVYGSYGGSDYSSTQYKEDLKKFRKMALESQEHSSSEYSGITSEYGLQPFSSSTEGQGTQEMESIRKETTTKNSHESS
ncbi:proline-rich receptor-like protein kinase PERK15 isoform X2 [Hevea brasiliensis]|uniref:proline-rich receptor-like protein kinase PERK15 isoform X2 n=1 Tax=Hevea brasiliensis TaxID=3981 RepID=UPI0025F454F1|nr:proline-rich receptor-like protein kinase PERK15 isoform X2 [Hevea brasiliensis]